MPDNAALYISDPSLVGSRLLSKLPEIQKHKGLSDGKAATGLKLTLAQAEITMNFMPPDQRAEHLRGLSNWVQSVQKHKDDLLYVLSRIRYVVLPIGCGIAPGFDEEGKVEEFLFSLNAHLNALLFIAQTLFDCDGQPIAGYYYDLMKQEAK